jgi:hypothetical protein
MGIVKLVCICLGILFEFKRISLILPTVLNDAYVIS